MRATVKWALLNVAIALVVVLPAIMVLLSFSTAIAGHDDLYSLLRGLPGAAPFLYVAMGGPLVIGVLLHSVFLILLVRRGPSAFHPRVVARLVAPLAFVPLLLTGFAGALSEVYIAVPLLLGMALYVLLAKPPPGDLVT